MPFLAACNNDRSEESTIAVSDAEEVIENDTPAVRDTLIAGYTDFSFQFNPFYAETTNDNDVVEMTSVRLLTFDREGDIVENAIEGEIIEYGGKEYKYEGISNVITTLGEDGEVVYDFVLRQGVQFSDGEVLNADDAIFTMYVLADPSYSGASIFSSLPITGLQDYQSGMADRIGGIVKTGEYSFRINMSYYDVGFYNAMNFYIAPMHIYGNAELYNYDEDMFGFEKGKLDSVVEVSTPIGAGAYIYRYYKDGIVFFESNGNYYKGVPNIKYVEFHEVAENKMLSAVVNGDVDIGSPVLTDEIIKNIENVNGGALSGAVLATYVSEHNGYGYIGICADTIKVGEDKASDESKNLRKAFATLFAAYRESAVNEYFGEAAYLIEYPISSTSWAAPSLQDADFKKAYSVDVNGYPIYHADMTESEKVSAALNAVIDFFIAAGYNYDSNSGKFVSAPEGASLKYEVIIHGNGKGNHPLYNLFINAKNVLNSMGIIIEIIDVVDSDALWSALDTSECQIWAAAWNTTSNPELYQRYHSSNVNGLNGSVGSNEYGISDETLDYLISTSRISADKQYQKDVIKDCFEIVSDWGVELPVYQRLNATVVNVHAVDIDSYALNLTVYWDWINDIHNLKMN